MIPDNNDCKAEVAELKNQMFILLLALVVISGTFAVYIYREATNTNKDFQQLQPMSAVIPQQEAAISNFLVGVVFYGNKHPDFVPILKKYGVVPTSGGATPPAH